MKGFDDEIYFAPVTELAARLRKKEFTAKELAEAFADRLEKFGPQYNALALSLKKKALREAKDTDWYLKAGRFGSMLSGIPYGAKDLLSVAGEVTTWGAKPYAAQKFDYTATAIQKLDGAGATLIGKLAMIELAGGPNYRMATASLTGPCLNPWNKAHWAGGSSSGSGAAVAAGLVPFALGSETSGSILTPASYCGLTGLRPTYGLVSRYGAMALSWTLDKIGPLCHTAEDCGHVLRAIAGGDAKDPGSAGKSFYFAPQYVEKWANIRVGYAPVDLDWIDPAAKPDFTKAIDLLKSFGMPFAERKLPVFPYGAVLGTILSAEEASIFEELLTSGKVDELADATQIANLKQARDVKASHYLKAMRIRSQIQQAFRELFKTCDVIVAPARLGTATRIDQPVSGPTFTRAVTPPEPGFTGLIGAANLAGLPAITFPVSFVNGLPIGIQLVSRPFRENTLIAIAMEFQRRTDFHKRRPAVSS